MDHLQRMIISFRGITIVTEWWPQNRCETLLRRFEIGDNNVIRGNPVVIGGVGGAGTRVYYNLCRIAGYNMGWLNTRAGKDCYPLLRWFYPKWVDPYLNGKVNNYSFRQMRLSALAWLRLCYPWQGGRWGLKNPRTLYLLEFFDRIFPSMCYIHVIRDGRDHAFNTHFSYREHETCLLNEEEIEFGDPVRKGLHWSRANKMAENYAVQQMNGRYLQSRLEDLCTSPVREIERIFDFLGLHDQKAIEEGIKVVRTPESLGRWKSKPPEQIASVEAAISVELRHYGYELCGAPVSSS